jgi:hypothetical protein
MKRDLCHEKSSREFLAGSVRPSRPSSGYRSGSSWSEPGEIVETAGNDPRVGGV